MKITFQKVHDRAVKDDHVTTVEIGMEENAATVQKMSEKRGEGLQLVALESLHRARLPALRLLLPVLMMILKAGREESRRNATSGRTEIDGRIRMLDRLPNPDQDPRRARVAGRAGRYRDILPPIITKLPKSATTNPALISETS